MFRIHDGQAFFEVLKNQPHDNPLSEVTKTPPEIVTVGDRSTGQFVYKVRPGSETSVVFGTIRGDEISASITDRYTRVGGCEVKNSTFRGLIAGIVVGKDGSISTGMTLPALIQQEFGR